VARDTHLHSHRKDNRVRENLPLSVFPSSHLAPKAATMKIACNQLWKVPASCLRADEWKLKQLTNSQHPWLYLSLAMHFLYPVYANRDLLLTSKGGSCASAKVIEPTDPAMSLCLQSHIVGLPLSRFCADCNTLIKLNCWVGN